MSEISCSQFVEYAQKIIKRDTVLLSTNGITFWMDNLWKGFDFRDFDKFEVITIHGDRFRNKHFNSIKASNAINDYEVTMLSFKSDPSSQMTLIDAQCAFITIIQLALKYYKI